MNHWHKDMELLVYVQQGQGKNIQLIHMYILKYPSEITTTCKDHASTLTPNTSNDADLLHYTIQTTKKLLSLNLIAWITLATSYQRQDLNCFTEVSMAPRLALKSSIKCL